MQRKEGDIMMNKLCGSQSGGGSLPPEVRQ